MKSGQLKVAIIGTGMIADVHHRSSVLAGADVVGVLGSTAEKSVQGAARWNLAHGYADLDELLSGPADVVHVCTPNSTHAVYAEAALEAGKHVVCEKPLGVDVIEAQRMADLAEAKGLVATVPFVYRYHPVVREIRARAQAGEFGAWNLLHGHYLQDWLADPGVSNWRVDPHLGGRSRAFADIGSHWCDLVEWISGERFDQVIAHRSRPIPERVDAGNGSFTPGIEGTRVPVETEDVAVLLMRTLDGVPASLAVSQVAPGRKNRLWFELDGAIGSARFDQENPEYATFGSLTKTRVFARDAAQGSEEQRRLSFLPAGHAQGYGDCFAAFVADTYATIDGKQPTGLPTFADGLRAANIIDAVLRSDDTDSWAKVAS
jgi:predicted dehydrogenase